MKPDEKNSALGQGEAAYGAITGAADEAVARSKAVPTGRSWLRGRTELIDVVFELSAADGIRLMSLRCHQYKVPALRVIAFTASEGGPELICWPHYDIVGHTTSRVARNLPGGKQ